jgi:hypothetical protein
MAKTVRKKNYRTILYMTIKSNKLFLLAPMVMLLSAAPLYAQSNSRKVTIGLVEKTNPSSLTIQEDKLRTKTELNTESKTRILGQDKKLLQLDKIKPKDLVAAVSSESGLLKIFVKPATDSSQLKRRAVHGKITNINGSQITLVHPTQPGKTFSFLVDVSTVIKIKGMENATTANLEVGQRVVAAGILNQSGVLLAKKVHVIPGRATGLNNKNPLATPSATLSVTPTLSSSPSATPTINASPSATPTTTL